MKKLIKGFQQFVNEASVNETKLKKEVEEHFHYPDEDDADQEASSKRRKIMDEPHSDDEDYSGMRSVMRKRYNKDMGISDDEGSAKSQKMTNPRNRR